MNQASSDFSDFMNPPIPYEPTEDEIAVIRKVKSITDRGESAEVKKSKDGYVVYRVKKKKEKL